MNAKSPFVLASLMIGLLTVSHSIANEQTKDEVRQILLSIQAELNEMESRKDEAPPAPKAPPAAIPEPVPQAELFPSSPPTPGSETVIDLPPEAKVEKDPVPAFLSRKKEVVRELQSVQKGLDQLNRQSGRVPSGLVLPSANPSEVAPPEPPVVPEPTPPSQRSEKERLAREPLWTK